MSRRALRALAIAILMLLVPDVAATQKAEPRLKLVQRLVRACAERGLCRLVADTRALLWDETFDPKRVIGAVACNPDGGGWLYVYDRNTRTYQFSRDLPGFDMRTGTDASGELDRWVKGTLRYLELVAAERERTLHPARTHPDR